MAECITLVRQVTDACLNKGKEFSIASEVDTALTEHLGLPKLPEASAEILGGIDDALRRKLKNEGPRWPKKKLHREG